MAIYYSIKAKGFDVEKKLKSKEEVCLEVRINQLSNYQVFEKEDSHCKSENLGTANVYPLLPICNNITAEIEMILAKYKEMEKE